MSPKELLYIEDALSHEQQIKCFCTDSANKVQDPELRNLISSITSRHTECFNSFYGLLN